MNKLLNLYNSTGRWGNIILLSLLIIFGLVNRLYVVVKHRYIDYIIEIIIIVIAGYLVYKIYRQKVFEISKEKIFKVLLVCGIALRIIFAIHDFYNRPVQDSDYEKHERLGQRLAFEGRFYDFSGVELRNFRQPGLPAIFAAGLIVWNNPHTFALIMILFSFGVLIAAYYLFRDLKNIAALISFGYMSVSPNMLFMASNSNTQLSFFFFLIILFIVLKNYSGKTYELILIGALLAAEMYIRFNFLMIFLLIPFFMEKHKDRNLSHAFGKLGLIYLSCLILYSPWIYRNYLIYGKIRLMPTTGMGLYSSNVTNDFTRAGGYNGVPDSLLTKYRNLSEVDFDKKLNDQTMDFIKNNPGLYIKGVPFRFIKYASRQDWTIGYFFEFTKYPGRQIIESFFQTIENFFFWIILFYPLVYLFKNKKLGALSVYLLWGYLAYSMVLVPISESRSRYNFPYILFPVFAVALIDRKKTEKQISR